jgi:uncharacterized protein
MLYLLFINNIMDKIRLQSQVKVQNVSLDFQRYLLGKINWNDRLIAIKGARGAGKTTILLQHLKKNLPQDGSAIYVAMDDLIFSDTKLYELAEEFSLLGGSHLLLDEVHKYPNWSREIKLIYDNFPKMNVVFTSSSILEIYGGESDLSRRAISYDLKEMSLREYLELEHGIKLPIVSLEDILQHHNEIATGINQMIKPVAIFHEYVKWGAYPYSRENKESYNSRFRNTVQVIIDVDLHAIENLDYEILYKIKKLIKMIASSVPFTPNISELSQKIGLSRPSILKALDLLEKARIVLSLQKRNSGIGVLTKPDKVFLNNTNLLYAFAEENTEIGTIRETFFANQLQGLFSLNLAEKGDFLVNDYLVFEIGGKNKTTKQIKSIQNAFVVRDDIEYGVGNIIPLWLFGFLY